MNSFLVKFGAVQSRIASYSCPPGVPGRVHAIRLRRCFQQQTSRAFAAHSSHRNVPQPKSPIDHELDDELDNKISEQDVGRIAEGGERLRETFEETAGQSPAPGQEPEPELVRSVPYPSIHLESRLRFMDARREKRSEVRTKVPGEDGDTTPPITFSTPSQDYEKVFFEALRKGNPHLLLAILNKMLDHDGMATTRRLLERLPSPTFSALLHCLDPKHFVGRYQELHKGISIAKARLLRLPPTDNNGYYKFCDVFLHQVHSVFVARQRSIPLSLSDFRYLLKCARATGNGMIADEVWTSLSQMKDRAIGPDLECYNSYLATLCWADTLNPITRHRLRVVHRNFEPRNWQTPPRPLKGYRTGAGGLKARVSEVFRDMIQAGVSGNEETFCHMMIAFAREGDVAGVEAILSRVWDIDVERLLKSDGLEPPVKKYDRGSPFHPSQHLLYVIAHAYGINNKIPTALRLIDYVSRQYSTPIARDTWRELLMWTHVLSMERHSPLLEDGTVDYSNVVGLLPVEAMTNLWATMISEPYNVRPTIDMYDRLIRNLLMRERFSEAQERMEEAQDLYKAEMRNLGKELCIFNRITPQINNPILDSKKRHVDFLLLKSRVNRQMLKAWVRNLIITADVSFSNPEWKQRGLPKFLLRWKLFLPDRIKSKVATGEMKFWSDTVAEKRVRTWKRKRAAIGIPTLLRQRPRPKILRIKSYRLKR